MPRDQRVVKTAKNLVTYSSGSHLKARSALLLRCSSLRDNKQELNEHRSPVDEPRGEGGTDRESERERAARRRPVGRRSWFASASRPLLSRAPNPPSLQSSRAGKIFMQVKIRPRRAPPDDGVAAATPPRRPDRDRRTSRRVRFQQVPCCGERELARLQACR